MLSLIVPCYNPHPELLRWQLEAWREYPPGIEIVLVDDCSLPPLGLQLDGIKRPPVPFSIARIEDGIAWNQPGARNLGAHLAHGEWLLFCDVDHRFTHGTLRRLLAKDKDIDTAYYFMRWLDAEGHSISHHLGTVMLSRQLFERIGGWDEDFCGHYGLDDVWFYERVRDRHVDLQHRVHFCPKYASKALVRDPRDNRIILCLKRKLADAGIYDPGRRLRFRWKCWTLADH